jgi:hypothetical protein
MDILTTEGYDILLLLVEKKLKKKEKKNLPNLTSIIDLLLTFLYR